MNLFLKNFFIIFFFFPSTVTTRGVIISSEFGWRTHPITHERKFHTGVDLAYEEDSVIRAVKDGTIIYAAPWGWYGNTIIIEHPDGDKTLYAHCKRFIRHFQDSVIKGEAIATVGATGMATGPHLHLEWWHNGVYCNPLRLLEHN